MASANSEECGDADHWYLVDTHGQKFKLPKTMLFLGRDECDVVVASQSVDKRHAILAYDLYLNRFKVKDLSTTHGTFVNNCRIPEQEYISLNHMDSIRLGQEAMMYHMEQASQISQHGGQLPDPLFIPSWASRARESPTFQVLPHSLGECQGCIAEQNLQHTCHCRQDRLREDSLQLENLHHHQPQNLHSSPHTGPTFQEYHQAQITAISLSQDPNSNLQHQQSDQALEQHKYANIDSSELTPFHNQEHTILIEDTLNKHNNSLSLDLNTCSNEFPVRHEESCQMLALSQPVTHDSPQIEKHNSKDTQTKFFVPLNKDTTSACNTNSNSQALGHIMPTQSIKHGQSPGDCSVTSTSSPPNGLALNGVETVMSPVSTFGLTMEDECVKPLKGSAYMEIPLKDYDSCTDSKSGFTAPQKLDSSLTKGNHLDSPCHKQYDQPHGTHSPGPDINPATSFTIELANPEQPTTKSLTICSSISQFVPTKMRKSFQGRKSVSSKASKNPDEHELAQSKADGTPVGSHSKARQSVSTALRTANLGDIGPLWECSERRSSLGKEMDADKKGPTKKLGSSKSYQAPQPPQVTLSSSSKSLTSSSTVSDYQHPANYLFDKMFDGRNPSPGWTGRQHLPDLKSLASQDKIACMSTEKALMRPVIDSSSYQAAPKINLVCSATVMEVEKYEELVDDDLQIIEDLPREVKEFEEKDDREDKVSEAGTYTIEADLNECQEEEEARRRIDTVFGVEGMDVGDVADSDWQPYSNGCSTLSELAASEDTCDDNENTLMDNTSSSHSPDDDTDNILPDFDDDDETSDMASTISVPTWVSQLNSLANQKSNRAGQEDGAASLSKKPPQSVNRKRSGTGRKLPSIPSDKSRAEHTNNWSVRIDSSTAGSRISSKQLSGNSVPEVPAGSCNNELPLHSHITVPASMSYKSGQTKKVSQHSATDPLANGGDNFVTPVLYKSPRDALVKGKKKDWSTKPETASSTPAVSLGKKLSEKLISPTGLKAKVVTSPQSNSSAGLAKKLVISDIFARKDSVDNCSTTSDLSSETGDGSLSRCSSKGKAAITLTRTNKTFQLRRARAGSLDEPPRLTKDLPPARPGKPKSGAASAADKSHGGYSSSKIKTIEDTSHAETAGMATQLVRKGQSNTTQMILRKSGSTVLSRTDSGIHGLNLKLQRASSLTITHPSSGGKGASSPKSHLRSTPTNRSSLTIKGISNISSKSHSQPGSRSSSPKMAEKMAWKRRKEYDARKSVAQARVCKTKDTNTSGVAVRARPSEDVSTDRGIIRSASFTNSSSQPLCLVSSSQDFTDKSHLYHQHYDLRKAFLPFQHNDRCSHSADEDDSIASTQDSGKSLVSLLEIPSAFTPPLLRNKHVSPESLSPNEASLSLRRRTLNMDQETSPLVTKSPQASRDCVEQPLQGSVQPSYDSLIAASVHQLSQKLTRSTYVLLHKLRKCKQTSQSPSPDDDDGFLNDSGKSEITAWEMANQELADTLKNLRLLERHIQIINMELFPGLDSSSDLSLDVPASQQGKEKLLEDIERKLDFQPIDQPAGHSDTDSPEMVEISGQF